jgi:carboxylesterase type B
LDSGYDHGFQSRIVLLISFLSYVLAADNFAAVDLGYAVHIPTYINETSSGLKYANYNNIRFAEPPLGQLRFRKPKIPPPNQQGLQKGDAPRFSTDCVSAIPNFFPDLGLASRPWGQEDCLFLNVRVPEGVKEGDHVPVLHFVHGSAFSYGSKDFKELVGDGSGLYDQMDSSSQKFIYVASNYRYVKFPYLDGRRLIAIFGSMGLYGWSSSPSEDMDANVGLHDSMAALQWTRKYISKFGGDPNRITAMGQSAGAGIIGLLMVAKGGHEDLPFSQVCPRIKEPVMSIQLTDIRL